MNKILVILLLSITILYGCVGTPIKWDDARKIKAGMTTEEVTLIMGKPMSVTARDGILIYVWVYVGFDYTSKTLRIDFKDNKAITAPPIPDSFKD